MNTNNELDILQENLVDEMEVDIETNTNAIIVNKDYDILKNKPIINNVELSGQLSLEDLGINLRDNNFSDEDKQKLDRLENYDDSEVRDSINLMKNDINGLVGNINEIANDINYLSINKANKTEIPDVSEFVNRTVDDLINYYTKSQLYTQAEVNALIGAIKTVSLKTLPEKPAVGETNVIYLIPNAERTTGNIYDEYIYVNNDWEIIGSTQIALSNYFTKDEITVLLTGYIKNTDYATSSKGGVVKADTKYGFGVNNSGQAFAQDYTNEQYNTKERFTIISKGTLEAVLESKGLVNKEYVDNLIAKLDGSEDTF